MVYYIIARCLDTRDGLKNQISFGFSHFSTHGEWRTTDACKLMIPAHAHSARSCGGDRIIWGTGKQSCSIFASVVQFSLEDEVFLFWWIALSWQWYNASLNFPQAATGGTGADILIGSTMVYIVKFPTPDQCPMLSNLTPCCNNILQTSHAGTQWALTPLAFFRRTNRACEAFVQHQHPKGLHASGMWRR